MSYLYTIGGYATLFGVGYAVYHVSTQKKRASTQAKGVKPSQSEPRKEDRKKKQRLESFTSDTSGKAKSKPKAAETSSWPTNAAFDDTPDDAPDNREFARQLAKAKEGTKFASKGDSSNQREKSVKQSRANKLTSGAGEATAISPPQLPNEVKVEVVEQPALPVKSEVLEASGVSDMIEKAPSTGPAVLRVTDSGSKKEKPKTAKAPEPVETKKQRQNRKKNEAAKAVREESEKERKVLEEKQRRQARIAEGRAAKDGSTFKAANGNSSVWTPAATNGSSPKDADAGVFHQPLDTFEKPAAPAAPTAPATKQPKQPKDTKSEGTWASSLPSEETQLELLKGDADEWNTVKTKSTKKTSKKSSSNDSGDDVSQSRVAAQTKQAPAATTKAAKPAVTQNFGAFSALSSNDEPAEDSEEEWDV